MTEYSRLKLEPENHAIPSLYLEQISTAFNYLSPEELQHFDDVLAETKRLDKEIKEKETLRAKSDTAPELNAILPTIETEQDGFVALDKFIADAKRKRVALFDEGHSLSDKSVYLYHEAMLKDADLLYREAERYLGLLSLDSIKENVNCTAFMSQAKSKNTTPEASELCNHYPDWAFDFRSLEFAYFKTLQAIVLPLNAFLELYPDVYSLKTYNDKLYFEAPQYIGEANQEPALGQRLRKLWTEKALELFNVLQDYQPNLDEWHTTQPSEKTRKKRPKVPKGSTADVPTRLYEPSEADWEKALVFSNFADPTDNSKASLLLLPQDTGLIYQDGKVYVEGRPTPLGDLDLRNMATDERINLNDIDTGLLRLLFSVIVHRYKETGKLDETIHISITDLAKAMDIKRRLNDDEVEELLKEIRKFHVIDGQLTNGKSRGKDHQAFFVFLSYESDTRILTFASPYANKTIQKIEEASVITDDKGRPKLDHAGNPRRRPQYTLYEKSSIVKDRNNVAKAIVSYLVTMIAKCGNNTYHIKVSTLMKEVPQLEEGYNRAVESQNATRFLKRTFTAVYRLLRTETVLTEIYDGIQIPDPSNPKNIPTPKTLGMVIEIKHNGKRPDKGIN